MAETSRDGAHVLPTRASVKTAAWGLSTYAAAQLAAVVLESASMPAAVAQAVIAEWGGGRLGVTWSPADEEAPETAAMVKRALGGAAIGAGMAASATLFLSSTRAVFLTRASTSMSLVAVALFTAGLHAMRDELLLHGIVLRSLLGIPSATVRVLACAVTSGAAAYGDGAGPRGAAVKAVLGLVFGGLWVRDRGAWLPWGAHAAWLFATGLLLSGGVFDAHVISDTWGAGDADALGGSAAVLAVLPFGVGALVWAARRGARPLARTRHD